MNIPLVVENFFNLLKDNDVVAIGTSDFDVEFIDELIKIIIVRNKQVYFIATTNSQASHLHNLGQKTISLNDKEIDVAIEFVDQIDIYNNFIKKNTKSFIRDKMISQSALNLITIIDQKDIVDKLDKDIYLEISSFAWERTLLNLQSYGVARIVLHKDSSFYKTEIGHYLVRLTLDSNILLEDFEYNVRNIPGVLETGLFMGTADTLFIIDYNDDSKLEIKKRT